MAVAFLLLRAASGVAQPDTVTSVDDFVTQEMKRQSIPGAAVAIIRKGEVIVARGYGLANVEHQVPVGIQTIFQSGSVGKQFTAAAVMLLVEDGELDLDESIRTYLPDQEWVAPSLNTTADGSLYLSLEDLISWDRGIRSQAILQLQSWEQIFEPVKLSSGRRYPYGFGWDVEDVAGQIVHRHSGTWQGFRAFIARYQGDDLSIIVLVNLAQSDVEGIAEGLAAIMNPELRPPDPGPISDDHPEVAERLRRLITAAAEGHLDPDDFAYVRAGFFPSVANEYRDMLRALGPPRGITLFDRRELGDDHVSRYQVVYETKTLFAVLGLGPDGKISQLDIESE